MDKLKGELAAAQAALLQVEEERIVRVAALRAEHEAKVGPAASLLAVSASLWL